MRMRSDVVKYFVGLVAILVLAGGATVWAYNRWEEDTTTYDTSQDDSESTPSGGLTGPVTVTGRASAMHIEGATINLLTTPFDVEAPEGGGEGATFSDVVVDGAPTSVEWDGAQPMLLEGEGGGLILPGVVIDAALEAGSMAFGTSPYRLAPANYTMTTSETVTFNATETSTVTFRGTTTSPIGTTQITASGSGRVVLNGGLTVATQDGAKNSVASVTLETGTFTVAFTRQNDGSYELNATVEGQVTTT